MKNFDKLFYKFLLMIGFNQIWDLVLFVSNHKIVQIKFTGVQELLAKQFRVNYYRFSELNVI